MISKNFKIILSEIDQVLSRTSDRAVRNFLRRLLRANKIVVCGAGRVGLATRAFAMRLSHLGLNAYCLGDATVPSLGKGDLLVVSSGSGETQTILDLVKIAKINQAKVALITSNKMSKMGRLANTIVKISAPSKTKAVSGITSVQPMTTLNEQCLWIFFDSIVLDLMKQLDETHDSMWHRHSNLE